jgi:hypothetical protein
MATGSKPSSACVHSVCSACHGLAISPNQLGQRGPQLAWLAVGRGPRLCAARTARRARPRARSEHMSWHDSRWFTGGYPTAKLRTEVNPSDGASPGTAWPEAEAVDRPRRGPHGAGAWRGAASDGRWLDDLWDDVHGKHPWTSVHLPDMVPSAESKQGRQTMERRSSPARSMAPELNGSEGANPLGRGAALGSGKPLGPLHSERGGSAPTKWQKTEASAAVTAYRGQTRQWCGQDAVGGLLL